MYILGFLYTMQYMFEQVSVVMYYYVQQCMAVCIAVHYSTTVYIWYIIMYKVIQLCTIVYNCVYFSDNVPSVSKCTYSKVITKLYRRKWIKLAPKYIRYIK